MSVSAKANRFNVSRIVYAVITKDDSTGFVCGPVKKFGDPMTVQITPEFASGKLYGGGVKKEDITKLTGATLKVDVNKIPIEVRAEIYGHKYENGVLKENKNDQAVEIAVGYEMEQTGDNLEQVWLLKGKAKPFGSTVQQSTDNINFSTDSVDIGFMPTEFTGDVKQDGDTANPSFTQSMANTFLLSVPGSTEPTLTQVATPTAAPVAGAVASGSTVALACTTEGAEIYYVTDDSLPENGTLYTAPIAITAETTIRAVALKYGMKTSEALSATYTLTA